MVNRFNFYKILFETKTLQTAYRVLKSDLQNAN